jgi:hypothetical protein
MPLNDIRAALDSIQQPGDDLPEETRQSVDASLAEAAELFDDPAQRPRVEQLLSEAQNELQAATGGDDALRRVDKVLKELRR